MEIIIEDIVPTKFELAHNYPNPFNEMTIIKYCLPQEIRVKLEISDSKKEKMKTLTILSLILLLFTPPIFTQSKSYWKDAPTTGTKIYSIEFIDQDNGWAKSKLGEILITTDSGEHWKVNSNISESINYSQYMWSADIYCSVMNTTDGGNTWSQYNDEMQEHFCQVYFRNENTGWQTAEEFLQKVTSTIQLFMKKNDLELLNKKATQCTEYYTDMTSGWALGWCVKNFKSN